MDTEEAAPPQLPVEPSNFDKLTEMLRIRMRPLEQWSAWLILNRDKINSLEVFPDLFLLGDTCLMDFNYLSHDQVVEVIKVFGGKWDKTINGERIDYRNAALGIRCYAGEAPPNCKLVEEEYEVPAVPARTEKRFKLVCKDEPTPSTPPSDASQGV